MKSFIGEYQHSLDLKGRLILPADFRGPLADGAVVGIGQNNNLVVYTPEEWDQVAERTQEMSRLGDKELQAAQAFFGGARHVAPDAQGRVPIALDQREYAGLDREVIVSGLYSRIEIWDAERWRERKSGGQASVAEASIPGFGI